MTQYKRGDLVHLISCQISLLETSSRKFRVIYIWPLVVYKIRGKFQYILIDIEGEILNGILTGLTKHFYKHQKVQLVH